MASELFAGTSAGTLRSLAAAFRGGQLGAAPSAFSIERVGPCPESTVRDLLRLSGEGHSAAQLALLLELHAEKAELRASAVTADFVWTGPEGGGSRSRDTVVVLGELFSRAERDVLVSTFVVQQAAAVFAPLAARVDAVPTLRARIFLHVARRPRDTVQDSEILREFADRLAAEWPGLRHPEVYYDPRGLSSDSAERATWHAKCVVVDDHLTFVTSANFTEWAQQRNVEAGVLVTGRQFTQQVRQQFDRLVEARLVRRLPGF